MPSCQTVKFYRQAISGQMEMLHAARPIATVKADPATSKGLKEKLTLVESLRAYAKSDLKLPVNTQFSTYADLHREFAVWVVYAAPEFSLEAKTWWYPIVGTMKYRGFFHKEEAKAEVDRLKQQGYEVLGAGVAAYSTLGWFSDPVLNTFIRHEESELAELIFHELSHPRVFFPGDTDFNEAFATANAQDAVQRWLRAKRTPAELAAYERGIKENDMILQLILGARGRLKTLYAQKAMKPEAMRERKAAIIAELRADYAKLKITRHTDVSYDRWFSVPINNARLCALASYHELVPGFLRLLREQGGDRERFYAECEKLKKLSPDGRREKLALNPGR